MTTSAGDVEKFDSSKKAAILSVVKRTVIPHTAFAAGLDRLRGALEVHTPHDVDGIPILGPSRTGKSCLSEEIIREHEPAWLDSGLERPVLRIRMPTKPTLGAVAEVLLQELGDPQYDKGSVAARESRAGKLARKEGLMMLFVEEFHQIYNPTRGEYMYAFGEFFKNFMEASGALFVPVGLPHAEHALIHNEQLGGRMQSPIRLRRFDWRVDDDKDEFVAILGSLEQSISAFFTLPKLSSDRIAHLMYCATGGLVGYVSKILDRAVKNAVLKKRLAITMDDLVKAHFEAFDEDLLPVKGISPFDPMFSPTLDDSFYARVNNIGVRPNEAPQKFSVGSLRGRGDFSVIPGGP